MMIETLERIALGSSTLESHTAKFQEDYKQVEGVIKCWEIISDIIEFNTALPEVKLNDDGNIANITQRLYMRLTRDLENRERELLRKWILKTCFPKELKALEIIKETWGGSILSDIKTGYVFGSPYIKLPNKEKIDLLKGVLK